MLRRTYLTGCVVLTVAASCGAQDFHPDIPRAWEDKEVERFELPLAQRDRSPRYLTSEEYYKLKVRPIYRAYPAYAKGQEPAGYLDSLKEKEPEIIFDASKLRTKQDWIEAGRVVFESDILFRPAPATQPAANSTPWPVAKDGVLASFVPGFRYYIRRKGVLERGINACANCHTRVMPDGSFLQGAQGVPNPPVTEANLNAIRNASDDVARRQLNLVWINFGAPWIMSREEFDRSMTREEVVRRMTNTRPSVFARQGTSSAYPPHIPSLIGIQDLKYLDSTGLVRNRSIGDIMRYAITNQGLDTMAHYGDFQPAPGATPFSGDEGTRYSDEQLYALALYLISLKPPPNPNPVNDHSRHGETIFRQQGCAGCHTPPLYTSNKLTPATGFKPPEDLLKTDDILNISVGTDPHLALETRRGTGFYKVPSLRGVWFRTGFGHGGWADAPGRMAGPF